MSAALFKALFTPEVIALVGASSDATKNTARPQRYLRQHGFTGTIVPIHPREKVIAGDVAYPTLAAAHAALVAHGKAIEHVYVMAGGTAVEDALEACGTLTIPMLSVFSDGFADVGEVGSARQAALTARAQALGVRVLGPNSMGVINIPGRVTLSVNATLEAARLPAGAVSVISQSGTMLGTLLSRGAARGLGFAKMISVGNEADLSVGELVDLLVDDPQTRVIALFLETLRDAPGLSAAAQRAQAAGKPIVAYKLGRSALGEALARSHTGALAGSDAAVDAFLAHCGIVRVEMLETLIEIAPLLMGRKPAQLIRAPRIAVVTTTGGGAASVVDRLGMAGIETLVLSPALQAELATHGVRMSDAPIIDLTMASSGARYGAVLRSLLASPDCDGVLAVVGSSAQFHPDFAVSPIVQTPWSAKPLVAFLTPHAEASLKLLAEQNIAAFRTPEACADALASFFRWRLASVDATNDAARASPDKALQAVSELLANAKGCALDEPTSLQLFAQLGVPVVRSATAHAPDFKHDVPYPVALKVRSADILHKTEAGGVALGLSDEDAYLARVYTMLATVRIAHPQAHIEGVTVQAMERGLLEAIVGYRHDPMVGPTVLVGAGGSLAEIYKDFALRVAPVSLAQAHDMLTQVKAFALLRGYRNLPRGDLEALAQAVVAMSQFALLPDQPVAEAEINPLIVKTEGVVAVDGLVTLRQSP